MKISDFIFKIAAGLFFSIIYLAISYLGAYLSVYWEWKWDVGSVWFMVGYITYSILCALETNNIINGLGIIINIGLLFLIFYLDLEPQLWIYIVLNTIVCSNIIIACVRRIDNIGKFV